MKIETLKVLIISTAHITKEDGQLLTERSYNPAESELPSAFHFVPATDEYGHWVWAGSTEDDADGSLECQCATAEDEGYSTYFTDILRLANKQGCTHVRFDRDGPEYDPDLPVMIW